MVFKSAADSASKFLLSATIGRSALSVPTPRVALNRNLGIVVGVEGLEPPTLSV